MTPGAEEDKKDNASLPDNIHERVEFVEVAESAGDGSWRSKSSYMGQTVGGNLKILKVRIDKDFKFQIYSSSAVKKSLAIWKMPLAFGVMLGAVVGGALGLAFDSVNSGALNELAARLTPKIACGYFVGLAVGVASGALIGLAAAVAFSDADGACIAGVASKVGSRALIGLAASVASRSRVARALIGLAAGLTCGTFFGLVAGVASSPLIGIAVGVSCGFGVGFQ